MVSGRGLGPACACFRDSRASSEQHCFPNIRDGPTLPTPFYLSPMNAQGPSILHRGLNPTAQPCLPSRTGATSCLISACLSPWGATCLCSSLSCLNGLSGMTGSGLWSPVLLPLGTIRTGPCPCTCSVWTPWTGRTLCPCGTWSLGLSVHSLVQFLTIVPFRPST